MIFRDFTGRRVLALTFCETVVEVSVFRKYAGGETRRLVSLSIPRADFADRIDEIARELLRGSGAGR
jgi:hypothetical protein